MFGLGRDARRLQDQLDELKRELDKTQSALRQLETEQLTIHDQVHRWMRRATAARNQEPVGTPATPVLPPLAAPPAVSPVRARILARRERARLTREQRGPLPESEDETNGVHA